MTLKKITVFTMLIASAVFASTISAETYPHEEAGVSVEVPDAWDVDGDDTALEATSPDELTFLYFEVIDAKSLKDAVKEVKQSITEEVDNYKPNGKFYKEKINGLNALVLDSATGEIEELPVEIGIMLVQSPTGKIVFVLGISAAKDDNKHKEAVPVIVNSIKPLK